MKTEFIIGTRRSKLAMRQTQMVIEQLNNQFPDKIFKAKEIVTQGDQNLKDSLTKIGGKGVFIKELEDELYSGEIDFAVHSTKDVTPVLPAGLVLGAILKRDSPFDCLISRQDITSLSDLPQGARIGTNSLRRQGQLLSQRPDLEIIPIRGNIETRISKIESEDLFGIILAEAGINRMKYTLAGYHRFSLKDSILPASGQGAITIECRADDKETLEIIQTINDQATNECVTVEREFLRVIGGSCNYPIGGFATKNDNKIHFKGLVASADGQHVFTESLSGTVNDTLGTKVAQSLMDQGALQIIDK